MLYNRAMSKRSKKLSKKTTMPKSKGRIYLAAIVAALFTVVFFSTKYESYASLYDASYTGSETCGECHKIVYDRWQESPHANMTRRPSPTTVVGNFDEAEWFLPEDVRQTPLDALPAARMYQQDGDYYMALRQPNSDQYQPFKIEYVIGYQYRQTYLTLESGGVLRRLPLQWSTARQDYFPYWNLQEGSLPSVADLWLQMTSLNSAWNLFCARCHTTHLSILNKDANHTFAQTEWVDAGIACEACHGPGSQHVNYFANNYVNRIVAFVNSRVRGEPAAYIANGPKLSKGEDVSVCARCHGPDILMSTTDIYRIYEPGYSEEGHINDLSPYFKQVPLEPGRTNPTVEVWDDGDPKGIAMIFRSFVESVCYEAAEVRCYNCHDPHNNKAAAEPGILESSDVSNNYCLDCHAELANQIAAHTQHEPDTEGSFCYDCHMPREILSIVSGVERFVRTHTMSSIPDPENSVVFGVENAPNACNSCHVDESPVWAREWMDEWYGTN
jgi:predicted CXXCH cytochrome family protein